MNASATALAPPTERSDSRILAASAWLGAGALWLAAGLLHDDHGRRFTTASILWIVADILVVVGLVLLLVLRPHGTSRIGTAAIAVAIAGRFAFVAGEVVTLAEGNDETPLIPLAALLTVLSMTAYGVVLLRRKAGRGSWSYLAVGLFPVVAMFPVVAITGEPSYPLIAMWGIPMALVGVSLARLTRP